MQEMIHILPYVDKKKAREVVFAEVIYFVSNSYYSDNFLLFHFFKWSHTKIDYFSQID